MTDKPIKGVISKWSYIANRIHGTCEMHMTYENGIEIGRPITTSSVARIWRNQNGVMMCETRNSIYILV